MLTDRDQKLIALLKIRAREPVASLARKLGVSRSTIQDRLKRLEATGVILGYDVRLSDAARTEGLQAIVTIEVEPKRSNDVSHALRRLADIEMLHAVSGKYDFVAMVRAKSAEAMDRLLDKIGQTAGVKKTESAIILSTRLERRPFG